MSIQRYSTPTVFIEVDPSIVTNIWFTLSCPRYNKIFPTKSITDMTRGDDGFYLTLTQEETGKLNSRYLAYAQARVLFNDGSAANSKIEEEVVEDVLQLGVINTNAAPASEDLELETEPTILSVNSYEFGDGIIEDESGVHYG